MNQIVSSVSAQVEPPFSSAEIRAPLKFTRRQDTKPVFHSAALTGGAPKMLFETEDHRATISDMRDIAETLSVDREGFELLRQPTGVRDLYDDDAIEQRYYPEIEALLRRRFGASRVVIFDATRRSDDGAGAPNRDGLRGPAGRLHVDYTAKSGPQRVKDLLGDSEAARLTAAGARIIQVNVWRPIRGPVERSPLALADASSVRQEDLIATDQIFPDRVGEIYNLAHAPSQRWYYAPRMTADEVLLIKGWDSLDDGRARFTPHSAFNLPESRADAPARESIEVRTFVIIEGGEQGAIAQTIQHYIDGAKSGRGEHMKPAFHAEATIFGYAGADLLAGPIQQLFDWVDANGPAPELKARVASIDLAGTVATVRLELDNWTGYRFTDLFTLLKIDGAWKITNKVFHLHSST